MSEAIGLMEGAFFVSRGDLIQWINSTFQLNVTKIEQLGTGAVYCQILDAIHPGKVPLSKVNWKAKLEWEFMNNFKILQQCFLKLKMSKHIEVEKLVKAKYQDNLEFAQWMKRYYDLNGGAKEYDAASRRGVVEPDFSFTEKATGNRGTERDKGSNAREKISKKKELRSLSPAQDQFSKGPKQHFSNLLSKKSLKTKETPEEVIKLHKYLLDMRKLLVEDEKIDPKDKLALLGEMVEKSLTSKIFTAEKENIEKRIETSMDDVN